MAKPEDYLDSFKAFLQNNQNQIAALTVVQQRPRDLTRSQLKALRMLLDNAGYSETIFDRRGEMQPMKTLLPRLSALSDKLPWVMPWFLMAIASIAR